MSLDRRELPEERPSTFNEDGTRSKIHPASVKGRFRRARTAVQVLLLAFFLVLPWINIGGKPALLLHIASGHFSILGFEFRATDAPLIVFLLLGFGLTLAFVTAVWGRAWCGWACPQTIFIEGVFRRIEVWIEGDHLKRHKLDQSKWTSEKIFKRGFKWILFLLAAIIISHSFIATFVGRTALFEMMQSSPLQNWTAFLASTIATAIVLFDFAWFKEQFCLIACPYGRFQSVLMDSKSLVVGYDAKRGEPRKESGDCINCYRCVQVCPTGIDIRRGTQLECIACTACIDACDDVMTRLKKPRGLIRYDSEEGLLGKKHTYFKPQLLIYILAIGFVFGGLAFVLSKRMSVDIEFHKKRGDTFSRTKTQTPGAEGDRILNTYILQITSQVSTPQRITLSTLTPGLKLNAPYNPITLAPHELIHLPIVLDAPFSLFDIGRAEVQVTIEWEDLSLGHKNSKKEKLPLVGPYR